MYGDGEQRVESCCDVADVMVQELVKDAPTLQRGSKKLRQGYTG